MLLGCEEPTNLINKYSWS